MDNGFGSSFKNILWISIDSLDPFVYCEDLV